MNYFKRKTIQRILAALLIGLLIGMQGVILPNEPVLASATSASSYTMDIAATNNKANTSTALAFTTTIPPNTALLKQVVLHIPNGYTIVDPLPSSLGKLILKMGEETIEKGMKEGVNTLILYNFTVTFNRSNRTLTVSASDLPKLSNTVDLTVELNNGILTNPSTNGAYTWSVEGTTTEESKITLSAETMITGGTNPLPPIGGGAGAGGLPPASPTNPPVNNPSVLTINPTADQQKKAQLPTSTTPISPSAKNPTDLVTGDGVKIKVPQGALSLYTNPVEMQVSIGNITTPPKEETRALVLDPVKYQRSFSVEGVTEGKTEFSTPVTLTFPYSISDLPNGQAVDKLAVYWWNPVKKDWVKLGGVVDKANNTISVPTYHFSNYAVMVDMSTVPDRLSGTDRFGTANAVAAEGWKTGADNVVLVNAYSFADALAGTPLAYKLNAPILLTDAQALTPATATELQKLSPKKIFLVGGTGVISKGIEDNLKSIYGNSQVIRYSGQNRYGTAAEVAKALGTQGQAVIASGEDAHFSDALAISSFAAYKGIPILFSEENNLPIDTQNVLEKQNVTTAYIAGGEGVISAKVFAQLPGASRYGGSDRYDTAIQIANGLQMNTSHICVVTGLDFPDALVAGNLAAHSYSPLIMVDKDVPSVTANYLKAKKSSVVSLTNIGGDGVISNSQDTSLRAMLK